MVYIRTSDIYKPLLCVPSLFADTTPCRRTRQGASVVRSGPLVRTCVRALTLWQSNGKSRTKEVLICNISEVQINKKVDK